MTTLDTASADQTVESVSKRKPKPNNAASTRKPPEPKKTPAIKKKPASGDAHAAKKKTVKKQAQSVNSTKGSISKKRGLGRGLETLLLAGESSATVSAKRTKGKSYFSSSSITNPLNSTQQDINDVANTADEVTGNGVLRQLPIEQMISGRYQPRKDFDRKSLEELADSIRQQGIMQPIVARPCDNKGSTLEPYFEIIAGERRWRAAQLAELEIVPVIVKEVANEAAMAMALIENLQREDLHPLEEAKALQRLQLEFELTQQEIAEAVGKSRAVVANLLRLLNLEPHVSLLLECGDIEVGHAKVLLALSGHAQSELADEVVARGLNVRQTERLLKQHSLDNKHTKAKVMDPNIHRLERVLGERVGASVKIRHKQNGAGHLLISYSSLDELDGILEHIQ